MEDMLQSNKTINHPITTPTSRDKQKKYKITSKDWSILWKVEVQSRTKRGNILFWKIHFSQIFPIKSTYTRNLSNPSFPNVTHKPDLNNTQTKLKLAHTN